MLSDPIWAKRKCEGLDCAAKLIALPMSMIGYGAIGVIVGAGMGYVVGSTQTDYRQLQRTPPMPELRLGVSLDF